MAVKLKTGLKKTTKTKLKTTSGIEEATKLVPDAFAIQKKMKVLSAKMKNLTDELTPIEKEIRDLVDGDIGSTDSVDLITDEGDVLKVAGRLQTRAIKSTDDVVIALEEFEEGLALKLAKFGIGDLDKYFSPEEMDDLCEVKEGNRRLTYK
jgi:hypothetical protein